MCRLRAKTKKMYPIKRIPITKIGNASIEK